MNGGRMGNGLPQWRNIPAGVKNFNDSTAFRRNFALSDSFPLPIFANSLMWGTGVTIRVGHPIVLSWSPCMALPPDYEFSLNPFYHVADGKAGGPICL
jgi:hypothetical protein